MLYSKSTSGFYSRDIHGDNIPSDAVDISVEEHAALLEGQSQGQIISADEEGNPILIDPPTAPSPILSCTPWQIRKKLNKEGLREAVEAYVASEQATQDEKDAWEFATEFREDNPLLVHAASMLGITDLHVFIEDAQTL